MVMELSLISQLSTLGRFLYLINARVGRYASCHCAATFASRQSVHHINNSENDSDLPLWRKP